MTHDTSNQLSLFSRQELPWLIMSLKPKWHESFASRQKKFEYRKRFYAGAFNAVVYVSGNEKCFHALAEFGGPYRGNPTEVATMAHHEDGVSIEKLMEYFRGSGFAFALPVRRYKVLPTIPLDNIRSEIAEFHPPQSYAFLSRNRELVRLFEENPDWGREMIDWVTESPSSGT